MKIFYISVKDYLIKLYSITTHCEIFYFALLPQVKRMLQLHFALLDLVLRMSCKNLSLDEQELETLDGLQHLDGLRNHLRMS